MEISCGCWEYGNLNIFYRHTCCMLYYTYIRRITYNLKLSNLSHMHIHACTKQVVCVKKRGKKLQDSSCRNSISKLKFTYYLLCSVEVRGREREKEAMLSSSSSSFRMLHTRLLSLTVQTYKPILMLFMMMQSTMHMNGRTGR